jgi:anthranilate phosphoribosyltransferase
MFAVMHHSAMRHVAAARRELGMRTVFNILGPMTNPAGVKRQLIGVYDRSLCRPMAEVLQRLESEHVMVVHADDGLDEISLAAPTHVAELRQGEVREYELTPEALGLERESLDGLAVEGAEDSLQLLTAALAGDDEPRARRAARLVALNAGAAIYVAGLADSIGDGVAVAARILADGRGLEKLRDLAAMTQAF